MMASNFNPDPPTAPGSDSDGRRDNTTADTDPHKDMDKEPSDLSDCHPGHDLVPEDEIFYDGETVESKSKKCKKKEDHTKFISVMDFTKDHLLEDERTEEVMTEIKTQIDRTVHIQVKYTSKKRPDTCYDDKRTPYPHREYKGISKSRTGTGYVMSTGTKPKSGDCPCPDCKKSVIPKRKYWKYRVVTATHVVYDDDEARETVITCLYDSEEQNEDVVKLYGVVLSSRLSQEERYKTDVCDRLVCVTHDEQSAQKLNSRLLGRYPFFQPTCEDKGIIVSHPHGGPKMVSVGNILDVTFLIKPGYDRSHKLPEGTTVSSDPTGELGTSKDGPGLKVLSFQEKKSYLRGATFTVPDGAKYLMRFDCNKYRFTFPPGTVIKTRDGTTIPDNVVFVCEDINAFRTSMKDVPRRISYDIHTCPGSSGAYVPVPTFKDDILLLPNLYPHAGSCGGCNQSCSFSWNIDMKLMRDYIKELTALKRDNEGDSDTK